MQRNNQEHCHGVELRFFCNKKDILGWLEIFIAYINNLMGFCFVLFLMGF